ncbi:MAG: flagellar basal body P-ring formation protein FlgA [Deltaproteobacteria bacterium]|nr:flagellar basal body P-ring formation protein FlgA [Deltaproteobacteria bacterium]
MRRLIVFAVLFMGLAFFPSTGFSSDESFVVIATRTMPIGYAITESDVAVKVSDKENGRYASDLSDVIGKRVKRPITANSEVRRDYIEELPLVKKGEKILLVAWGNGLKLSTVGVAKEDGAEGARVIVENVGSGKSLYATVIGSGTARVEF